MNVNMKIHEYNIILNKSKAKCSRKELLFLTIEYPGITAVHRYEMSAEAV
jgi:hypothetical protein